MDCTWITAQRTGAATALSAKFLARTDSAVVGILGCGVQGRSNLQALTTSFKLEKVFAYDTSSDQAIRYAQQMSKELQVTVVPVTDPQGPVAERNIVVTAGP